MSNCAKLFGAAVFFLLATVTSSRSLESASAIQQISFATGCIERRARLLQRLIIDTNSLPSNVNYISLVNELKRNMTENADAIRFTVDLMINDPKNTNVFKQTECKRFFVEYEKEINDVEGRLANKTRDALNKTMQALQDALNETNKALNETMKPLNSAAHTCIGSFCNELRYDAEATLRSVLRRTSQFFCADRKQSTYMRILAEMENGFFIQKGVDVVKETSDCVYGNNSHKQGSNSMKIDPWN